jgi:tryptophan halogenase
LQFETNKQRGNCLSAFPLRSISIVGEGVCAWLAALALARVLRDACELRVITSDDSAVEGAVAAVPSLHRLFPLLRVDEAALVRETGATFRLGAHFRDWSALSESFFQGFGPVGAKLDGVLFQHHWMRAATAGDTAAFEDYSMAAHVAKLGRFAPPSVDPRSPLSLYSYAWHFEAASLAAFLRRAALDAGVVEVRGRAAIESHAGRVQALRFPERRLETDFLVVCGARDRWPALDFGYEDWAPWLPCDRLQSARAPASASLPPFSECTAVENGWRGSVPLQHSVELVRAYASELADDEAVSAALAAQGGGAPRLRALQRGRPASFWKGNCLLLPGESLDPLESTSLHLAQTGITRFLAHFPVAHDSPTDALEYNRLTAEEYDGIRDLLALRYHASRRTEPMWQEQRERALPERLAQRLALFRDSGRITVGEEEHCSVDAWLTVLFGLGLRPETWDPLAEGTKLAPMRAALESLLQRMRESAAALPTHREFLERQRLKAAVRA